MNDVLDGGLQVNEFEFDLFALGEFAGADHHAEAGAVHETNGRHIDDEVAALPAGNVRFRALPDIFGIGGGDFALPEERIDGGRRAQLHGAGLLAHARGDERLRGRHVGRGVEKILQAHEFERAGDHGGGREQNELAAVGADFFLQPNEQADAGAVDELDVAHVQQAMMSAVECWFEERGFVANGREVEA